MLYPSVQDLTNENVNRYMLVIATAKSARYVTHKANKEAEAYKDAEKPVATEDINQKSVSVAVDKLNNGLFKIITE